jgi:amidase
MTHTEYVGYDALGLAALVRSGEVTPLELLDLALSQAAGVNPRIHAIIRDMSDEARQAIQTGVPDGPFRGVPFLLKDLGALYAGVVTSNGSRLLRDYVADHDTEMVRRFRAAGLVAFGKTNTPEFGLTPFTEPEAFSATSTPWDGSRTAGGSSGGSAAAVAAGVVPMAHGSDGGGSIRIPAACCGLFGMKPSRGRNPTGPDFGELWQGLAVDHVLTRSVRDSAAALDAVSGPDVGAPYAITPPARPYLEEVARDPEPLRVAFSTAPLLGHAMDADCRRAVEEAARLLEQMGHHVEESTPALDAEAFNRAFLVMVCGEVWADLRYAESLIGRRATADDVEVETWALALLGGDISGGEYARALRELLRAGRTMGVFFQRYDVLLSSTLSRPPALLGSLRPPAGQRRLLRVVGRLRSARLLRALGMVEHAAHDIFEFIPWTPLFNATGQPAMSVPLSWNDAELPIGIHFAARFGDEATLFRLAGQLERARPWFDRLPAWVPRAADGAPERARAVEV